MNPTITTLQDLYQALETHDWFYEMSDDHSVWTAGCNASARLNEAAKRIPGGYELIIAFTHHHYSGDGFGCPKAPKPTLPPAVDAEGGRPASQNAGGDIGDKSSPHYKTKV